MASSEVRIDVLDTNDNRPVFAGASRPTEVTVEVTRPSGTVVTCVQARDLDSDRNGAIAFSFHKGCLLSKSATITITIVSVSCRQTFESNRNSMQLVSERVS